MPQLKELLVLVEQRETAAPPVRGCQRKVANGTGLALVPLLQQALDVLGRRVDLRHLQSFADTR